jgi:hypothetical protein
MSVLPISLSTADLEELSEFERLDCESDLELYGFYVTKTIWEAGKGSWKVRVAPSRVKYDPETQQYSIEDEAHDP